MTYLDVRFPSMGTEARIRLEHPGSEEDAHRSAARARALIERNEARLSRFRPSSCLNALNAAPDGTVSAGPLLRRHVAAARWAAQRTGGLVDPTVLRALEEAGYGAGGPGERADVREALAATGDRCPARPHPAGAWRRLIVDDDAGTVSRPPGVQIDLGGTSKGLSADEALAALGPVRTAVVDCGGDLAVGGDAGRAVPVVLRHPHTDAVVAELSVTSGGVATSGIGRRVWRRADGTYAHHLIDPSTGRPAWTGVLAATALAPSALEAEVLAKAAVLAGPIAARSVLRAHGGVVVLEDGAVEHVAPAGRVAAA